MRILNVTQSYIPFVEFGGPPVKVHALSEHLVRHGNQVTVLTADWGLESRWKAVPPAIPAERSPFGWRTHNDGVQVIYLPTWFRYRALTWNPAVKRFCRARLQNFDIVHIFGLYDFLGPAVADICRARNIPYVVEPIGMFVPIVRNLWLKGIYHGTLGKAFLRGASSIVVTSQQEADELAAGGLPRQKIIYRRNGVDGPETWPVHGSFRKTLGISSDAKLILFLGRLSSKKSPDLLLQSFATLAKTFSDNAEMYLVYAGPDEDGMKAKLQRTASQLGVAAKVKFAGPTFGEQKWAAYRDADVFVLPSQNENFGNTAAEAVVAGTPVIVTENCGVAPLLAGAAGLVIPHDAAALFRALASLFSDAALYAQLRAGCAIVASQLGWEEPAREMENLYDTLAVTRLPINEPTSLK